jgi:class 3 adenylate cyclase/pimeloyl-ACP methyl ester carboxylesterase
MAEPQVQYAKTSDGVSIAFASMGEGPPLVRLMPPGIAHVQRDWAIYAGIFQPLTSAFRVIWYDPRGTGLSDRDEIDFSMEAMMRDLDAVIERSGLQSFAVHAIGSSVPIAVTYAATFPDRVSHLILVTGWTKSSDFTGMPAYEAHEALLQSDWTLFTETVARVLAGIDDPSYIDLFAEHMRACIEPGAYRANLEATKGYDVSVLLPDVRAQTLVLHHNKSRIVPVRAGQKLAAGIPSARFLAVDGMSLEREAALIEEFAGTTERPEAVEPGAFRTILFTDMEGSTTLTQKLGDAKAQEVLRTHNSIVRDALKAHSGTETKHTGDGIMASFTSASAALEAAVAIQKALADHNEANADAALRVRIGLNAGEPVAEEEDLFGTAVQLAARVCDKAEPGQILVADVVQQLAAGKGFTFAEKGEATLKGFEKPVRLHEVNWHD